MLVCSESKDPWTIKDAAAHITHWKADVGRIARGERKPSEERGFEKWFSGKERGPDWPGDLDGHSSYHRLKDIERALKMTEK